MGYYLPPKSYLRPKPRLNIKRRILILTTAGITLIAAGFFISSIEFGDNKTAQAGTKEKKQTAEILMPVALSNSNVATAENGLPVNSDFPVLLAYFKANEDQFSNELKWSTMQEYKNDCFIVEKSVNGTCFEEIGCIDSKKSSDYSSDYSFIDDSICDGMVFYRLKQVSENGHSTFIALEKVIRKNDMGDLTLFIEDVGPQPFDKYFNINYYTDREGGVSVELFDKNGTKIYKTYTNAREGYNTCRFIDGEKLTDTDYTVRIANSSGAFVKRIKKGIGA